MRLIDIGNDILVNPDEVAAVEPHFDGIVNHSRARIILKGSGKEISSGASLTYTEVIERLTEREPYGAAVPGER